jgi:hypothetical protein
MTGGLLGGGGGQGGVSWRLIYQYYRTLYTVTPTQITLVKNKFIEYEKKLMSNFDLCCVVLISFVVEIKLNNSILSMRQVH